MENRRMKECWMANGEDRIRKYPVAHAPMVGRYMVRKKYVAFGVSAIDAMCGIWIGSRSRVTAPKITDVNSVLLSQCGHLGDLIMTLPTLHWIRRNRPEMRIGLVVGSWAKPMLKGIAELYDTCYFADHFMLDRSDQPLMAKLARHRESWKAAGTEIRQARYDAAIECYSFLQNSIPLLYACDIPRRIGFTSGGFGALLTHGVQWKHESRPFLDYPRDLLRALFNDKPLDYPLQAYYPAPPETDKLPAGPYVLVQTGTGNSIKEWPEDKWIRLVNDLKIRGVTVVLAGAGSRERDRAARISEAVGGLVDLCDRLTWDEFVALIAGATHVVCLDSSASHLAAAFHIPTTVIMSGTNDQGQFGPANDQAQILTFPTPCAPCFRTNGCDHMACIRQVRAEDAANAVLGRLGPPNL
jgi:ADP-heptose:LPS heptosyltransferase